jgi:hypothetical protein
VVRVEPLRGRIEVEPAGTPIARRSSSARERRRRAHVRSR